MKNKLMKINDSLWAMAVKKRAGNVSEISGKTGSLHAHHIVGKPNYRLRYELDNGICLTAGEHFFTAHNAGRVEDFRKKVMALRGKDIFERLSQLKWDQCKTDMLVINAYLKQKIKEME